MERINGYLVVDDFQQISRKPLGYFAEEWITDGKEEYLFKNYPAQSDRYREMFFSYILKELGLKVAEYDLARRKEIYGVISKNYNPSHFETYTIKEIIKIKRDYNLNDLTNVIINFCNEENWGYCVSGIKRQLLIQFIIQILLGNCDLQSKNIEIQYNTQMKKIIISPFYDLSFYGNISLHENRSYEFQYNYMEKDITPLETLVHFLNNASNNEIKLLKEYLEKIKKINLYNKIRCIEEQTKREVPYEIKYNLIEDTQNYIHDVDSVVNKR